MLLVIGAMPEELAACKKRFPFSEEKTSLGIIYKSEKEKIFLCTSGIGLVNAAAMLSLCLTLHPEIEQILVLGTTGAIVKELHQGSLVAIAYSVYGLADVRAFGYEWGQIPQMPPVYEANHHWLKILENHFSSRVKNFHLVNCASLDVFVEREEQIENSIRMLPVPIQIVDMETAAFYQVAFRFHKSIMALKIVTDSLLSEKDAALSFDQFLPTASEKLSWVLEEVLISQNQWKNKSNN